ncbi:serine/threonine protein kinase [Planctomycetes bacterium K23_9]|uniref:Serine/threonine-protein kinase PknA n=1 Tax=Stieleria marina TaxID=1930275 RepID=A0A517NVX6_9BACT|nr:Serine/threonine-protein kinase PknA [Planctomycetes bacterium K23_9]
MNQSEPKPKLTFCEAAVVSKLVKPRQLKKVMELTKTDDESIIAATLVKSGVITQYQSQQLEAGRTKLKLGPYLVTDWIGQGGMGRVYKAVHDVMGRVCAVKVLPLEKMTDESRDAFIQEIRVQASLDSPYVVRAYDAGQDGSIHYLVTEFVPGIDLRRLVRNNGVLSMNHAASIVSQAALGLQYAHEMGLIHRDVKPGNILVTPDGHAKVSDIGLAAYSMGLSGDVRAGKIVGTADYLSPEQIRHPMELSPASDIYSLGCTLYYCVTGKVPFPGGDSKSKCKRHCEQTPWHPRRFNPDLSEDFVDVIADMMEKDPARRTSSAQEVAERLEPWTDSAIEAINRPIDRQSWMPPPPPNEPVALEPPRNENTDSDPATSGGFSVPGHSGVAPSIPVAKDVEIAKTNRPSHALPIAIALAIAVPISVLIGAIIGFVVRGYG